MKYEDVINRIDRYIKSDKYQPIIVDMPNIHLYKKIIEHYNVGCYDIQKASSFCMEEGLPLMDKLQYSLSMVDGVVFLKGLSCYLKLQGELFLQKSLRSLLDLSLKGKLIVFTFNCASVLSKMDNRLQAAGRISIVDGEPSCQLSLCFINPKLASSVPAGIKGINNLQEMETFLEEDNPSICVITTKTRVNFPNSMFDIVEYSSEYQVLAEQNLDLANIGEAAGTESQWAYLLKEMENYEDWHQYVVSVFGSNLADCINGFAQYDSNKRWIYFLALATSGVKGNEYLTYVISKSKTFDDFIMLAFCAILKIPVGDPNFQKYYDERKVITSNLADYSDSLDCFCKQVYGKEENAILYLTDNTRKEKEHIIELIGKYKYSASQLAEMLPRVIVTWLRI